MRSHSRKSGRKKIQNGNQHGLISFSHVQSFYAAKTFHWFVYKYIAMLDRTHLICTYFTVNLPVIESHGHVYIHIL